MQARYKQTKEGAGMRAAAPLQEIINRSQLVTPVLVARPDCIGGFGLVGLAGTGCSGMQGSVRHCHIACLPVWVGRQLWRWTVCGYRSVTQFSVIVIGNI